jgi:hypothetical protein
VIAVEDTIEQGGLAGAEKPGEHGYRNDRGIGFCVVVNHVRALPDVDGGLGTILRWTT